MSEPLTGRVVDHADSGDSGEGGLGGMAPGARWLAKAWLVPVIFGAASALLGALVLFWPGHTVGALTVLFGSYLLITGCYRFAHAIQLRGVEPVARAVALVLAALSAGIGVVCLFDPFSTASAFATIVGVFWLAAGAIMVLGGWQRRRRPVQTGRTPGIAGGVFSMIIGLLIMLFPHASLVFLAVVLGCWLLFIGGSAITTGLVARRLLRNVAAAALYWP